MLVFEEPHLGFPVEQFNDQLTECNCDPEYPLTEVEQDIWDKINSHPKIDQIKDHFRTELKNYPYKVFDTCGVSFDEMCKLEVSGPVRKRITDDQFDRLNISYEDEPILESRFRLVWKLQNSMWRWGLDRDWNSMAAAYNSIRNFSFGDKFEVCIDWTSGCNAKGMTKNFNIGKRQGVFLDGVFGFLVYLNDEHVMTIGWSLAANKRILVHQIQLTHPKGNRWLFKLDKPYFEYTLDRMRECFQGFDIYLIDGHSAADEVQDAYWDGAVLPKEKWQRVHYLYSQKFASFRRRGYITVNSPKIMKPGSRRVRFHRLESKCQEVVLA